MTVFVDTNIILDVALERPSFVDESKRVLDWCIVFGDRTLIAWHTISNGYYILEKQRDDTVARAYLLKLLHWVKIAPTSTELAIEGLLLPSEDVEDTLQALCARAADAKVIVTRNVADFVDSPVEAMTPTEFLEMVG